MARSALDNDDSKDVVAKAMSQPEKLKDLDLDLFSKSVESLCERDYRSLFYFTAGELENPHKDIRGQYDEHSKMHLEGE